MQILKDGQPITVSTAPQFERYIGIDYCGAEVATASLKGLRVYLASANGALASALRPALNGDDRKLAEIEGWILGVG